MKNFLFKVLFTLFVFAFSNLFVQAQEIELLILPSEIFNSAENFYGFESPSEIVASDVIKNLNNSKNIRALPLNKVKEKLSSNNDLKNLASEVLNDYEKKSSIDFAVLKRIAQEFRVKSVVLISSYSTSDKSINKRGLWEILEVASAFEFSYPFELKTNAVLIDSVNDVIMWSGKYSKLVTDSSGKFIAKNQTQAFSQLEKIKNYSENNISKSISQGIYLRFYPKEVRNISFGTEENDKKFIPNALEELTKQRMIKDLEQRESEQEKNPTIDMFEF